MAKKRIMLIEDEPLYNFAFNSNNAKENNLNTPETILQSEINEIVQKIQALSGAELLINNSVLKLVIKEKIETYKDTSATLIKIAEVMAKFKTKMET